MSAAAAQVSMSASAASTGLALTWPPQHWQARSGRCDGIASPFAPALAVAALEADDDADFSPGDRGFIALCAAYRASGGMARSTDVAHCLAGRGQGDSRSLEALIASGQVFSLEWRQARWLPMFQFQPQQPDVHQTIGLLLAELSPVMDGWQLAAWFVQANTWLAESRPLDLLASHAALVLAAARADRYVIKG